ncbi:MAG: type II toxin-antitoxin system RelE/ParE family toxin [Verrucomicrobia bacterium]|nr:MAG: type II toxin-antitoxin system RelE/ParE family toxin [Verrucomicrobiota bacterium]
MTRRPQAAADILEIWDFIADDSFLEADRWVDRLDEKLSLWATQPLIGRPRDELASGLRSMPFGRYVVYFMPMHDGIDVVRVLHSTRDTDNHFAQ